MKKTGKKWLGLLLVSAMLILATACGNKQGDVAGTESGQPSSSSQDEQDSQDEQGSQDSQGSQESEAGSEEGGFTSEDLIIENEGRKIPATFVVPEGEGKFPLVVMHHGFAGNRQEGGGFKQIAEEMARQGIASIRFDFPGCGESEAPFTEFNFTNNKSDSRACLNYALENEKIDKEKVGIFGYSMGGRISILLTQEESPYQAIALLAPAAFTSEDEQKASTEESIEKAKETGTVAIEWFDSELEVGQQYYIELLDSFAVIDEMKNTMPTLLMYGDKDVMVTPEVAKACGDRLEAEMLEIKGADHGYGFYSGEDEYAGKVVSKTVEFFKEQLK